MRNFSMESRSNDAKTIYDAANNNVNVSNNNKINFKDKAKMMNKL